MDFATFFFNLSLLCVSITVQNFSTVPIFKVKLPLAGIPNSHGDRSQLQSQNVLKKKVQPEMFSKKKKKKKGNFSGVLLLHYSPL